MERLELRTDEGIFGIARERRNKQLHFYIDCACSGKDGKYSGIILIQASVGARRYNKDLETIEDHRFDHTFYANCQNVDFLLEFHGTTTKNPLVIACRDCGRKFFLEERYRGLMTKINNQSEPKKK